MYHMPRSRIQCHSSINYVYPATTHEISTSYLALSRYSQKRNVRAASHFQVSGKITNTSLTSRRQLNSSASTGLLLILTMAMSTNDTDISDEDRHVVDIVDKMA